jgi:nucleotide-binding universal stress UspA family protein
VAATVKTSSDIAEAILETAEETGVFVIVIGVRGNSLADGILTLFVTLIFSPVTKDTFIIVTC